MATTSLRLRLPLWQTLLGLTTLVVLPVVVVSAPVLPLAAVPWLVLLVPVVTTLAAAMRRRVLPVPRWLHLLLLHIHLPLLLILSSMSKQLG